MKKVFAFILALSMIFMLTACGGISEIIDNVGGGNTDPGYKGAVELLADVKFQGKVDKIENLAPEAYWAYYESYSKMPRSSKIDEVTYTVEMEFAAYQEYLGEGFTYSLTIEERSTYTEAEMGNIKNTLSERFGIDPASVTEAKLLDVDVVMSGNTPYTEAMDVSVVKIGNTWYCAELYLWDEGCEFMFPTDFLGGWG